MSSRSGQLGGVNRLPQAAVALIIVAIVIAAGVLVLGEFQDSDVNLEQLQTTFENDQPTATNGINSSSGFQQYTLDNKGPEDLQSVDGVDFSDVSAGSNVSLTQGDNFTVDLTAATNQVNVTKVDAYDSSSGDSFFTNYTNNTRRVSHGVLGDGIASLQTAADFLTVLVILVVASVLFVLLQLVRSAGREASA